MQDAQRVTVHVGWAWAWVWAWALPTYHGCSVVFHLHACGKLTSTREAGCGSLAEGCARVPAGQDACIDDSGGLVLYRHSRLFCSLWICSREVPLVRLDERLSITNNAHALPVVIQHGHSVDRADLVTEQLRHGAESTELGDTLCSFGFSL